MNLFTHSHVPAVAGAAALEMIQQGAVLVDIREIDEWRAGHAPMAVHIPMGELGARSAELPATEPMLVICRSGRRSDHAVQALVSAGYNAINLIGGMQAWQQAGGAVVRDDGSQGTVI